MGDSSILRHAVFAIALTLSLNLGCGDGDGNSKDGGPATDGGPITSCEPDACDGMPVPAIACADGPTLIVCERGSDGQCHVQVRCGEKDGGPGADGGGGTIGRTCGGIAGLACAGGLFCNYEVEAGGTGCAGIADAAGVCATRSDACPELYAPVCGCDYRSYSSPCDAHSRGISVMHGGLCTAEECTSSGGRPVYSDGASTPSCKSGDDSFQIPGDEPAICCVPGEPGAFKWYQTCGAPVCGSPNQPPSGLPACDSQQVGAACTEGAPGCDLGNDCGTHLICASSDPTQGPGGCPISRANSKMNIRYLEASDLAQKHDEVMQLAIAEYTYRSDPQQQPRLGFIIEDVEPSAFVDEARERVDLYAYTSAVIAAVKVQEQRIRQLEDQVRSLTTQLRAGRRVAQGR